MTRVWDTMKSAAGALAPTYTLADLKIAKAAGCSAFKASRVYEAELIPWLKANKAALAATSESIEALKLKIASQQERKLRIANDAKEGKLIELEKVKRSHAKLCAAASDLLTQKLENEFPALVAGLDVAAVRVHGKRLNDAIRAEFREMASIFA